MLTRQELESHLTWTLQFGALVVALVLGRAAGGAGAVVILLALFVILARSFARRVLERILPRLVKENLLAAPGDLQEASPRPDLIRSYADLWRTWKRARKA